MMNVTPSVVSGSNLTGVNEELGETDTTISDGINLYFPPILIPVGTVCNTFTVFIMRTPYFRSMSMSVYLTAGAVNDAVSLLIFTAHWLYVNFPHVYIRTEASHIMCKFFNFYGWSNTDLGIMITMSMAAERACAIAIPLQAAKRCTKKRARIVIVTLLSIVVAKQFHFWFSSDMVPQERSERLCDVFPPTESYKKFWLYVWPWIHISFLTICFIIMIGSNAILVYNVRTSITDQQTGGQKSRQLAFMFIGETVLVLALTFPFSVHISRLAIQSQYDSTIYSDPESAAREGLIFSATFYMLYSNKCVNFFMYCLLGERFRRGFLHVVQNCCLSKTALRERRQPFSLYSSTSRSQSEISSTTSLKINQDKQKQESSRSSPSIRWIGNELTADKTYTKEKQAHLSSDLQQELAINRGIHTKESKTSMSNRSNHPVGPVLTKYTCTAETTYM